MKTPPPNITHLDAETVRLARIPSTPEQDLQEMRKAWAAQIKANRPSCRTVEEYKKQQRRYSK